MTNETFRNELKYLVTDAQLALIEVALRRVMRYDSNAVDLGRYIVRSLYFDDADNTSYYENENGVEPREKYRIRIYNANAQNIRFELKQKKHGKTLKHTCAITENQCRDLMAGRLPKVDAESPPILQKLRIAMQTRLLRPVVIVQYTRQPFVLPNSDVRVTLDRHLTSSSCISSFLEDSFPARPVMPLGRQLLEVKFDNYLPGDIYQTMSIGHLQKTAFSKFYLCRKYSLRGLL